MIYTAILLEEIERFTDRYQFSFQFWGKGENNVYINKGDVELVSFGGEETVKDVLVTTLNWLYKVNPHEERIFDKNPNF